MKRVGRYEVHEAIGRGGMATVYLARLVAAGLSKPVALKQMHPPGDDPDQHQRMFADEARLAMRISHPNVVGVNDVLEEDGTLHLVMDLVLGDTLAALLRQRSEPVPPAITSAIVAGLLRGLHAAHEARDERGGPLALVHRDVSPQNVMVGVDGVARVLDFGIAKAMGRLQETTQEGRVKGKLAYVAPEQLAGGAVDRRADVFSAGVVLWEALAGERLFDRATVAQTVSAVLSFPVPAPSTRAPRLGVAADAVVQRALERAPDRRFATARELCDALEQAIPPAPASEVGAWVERIAREPLARRRAAIVAMESGSLHPPAAAREPARSQVLGDDEIPSELLAPLSDVPAHAAPGARARAQGARVPLLYLLVLVLVLVLLLGIGVALLARGRPLRAAPEAGPALASPVPASRALVAPDLSPPAADSPSTDPAPARHAPGAPPAAERRRVPPKAKPDCKNPFVIDARGNRVPRAECF